MNTTHTRRSVIRSVAIALTAATAIAIAARPSEAMRHLKMLKSFPSADTSLAKSPDAVKLWLSEPAELGASKIEVATDAGAAVATAALSRDTTKDAPVVAKFAKPLSTGGYAVTWKAMSKDGHVVNGKFAFKVTGAK